MPTKKHKSARRTSPQTDSAYILKVVLFFVLGTVWVRVLEISGDGPDHISIPLGLILGLFFASHEHFRIDRKIEYAVLLVATFVSYYLPVGLVL